MIVFPGSSKVESEYSLLKESKDTNFTIEIVLHIKQFDMLCKVFLLQNQ